MNIRTPVNDNGVVGLGTARVEVVMQANPNLAPPESRPTLPCCIVQLQPMSPGIFVNGRTLPGVFEVPTEPPVLTQRPPWVTGPIRARNRVTIPSKPLILEMPPTSTRSPSLKAFQGSRRCPGSKPSQSSSRATWWTKTPHHHTVAR